MNKILLTAVILMSGLVQAQTSEYTNNLVQPTVSASNVTPWNNAVYQNSLTCFGWGNPGYCGPNPIATPGYNLNFSFGWTDVYQQQNISNLLPNSGSGLRVDGYHFGFRAKNGNGWDNGQTDLLFAYVQFNDGKGSPIFNHSYNLSQKFDWTDFNYYYTLTAPLSTSAIGSVRYGFVGQDTNNWAGPYGPEITNISFRLRYSVDPCATNPLHSVSCAGFSAALANLAPSSMTAVNSSAEALPAATSSTPTVVAAPTMGAVVATTVGTSGSTSPSTSSRNAPSSVIGQALNTIARNQQNQQTVINQTVNMALSLAIEASDAVQSTDSIQAGQVTQFSAMMPDPVSMSLSTVSSNTASTAVTASSTTSQAQGLKLSGSAASALNQTADSAAPLSIPLLDRTNPINSYVEPKLPEPSSHAVNQGPSVNSKVAANQAAGGVDLASMTVAPQGFADYTQLTLRDAAFYAPREVYRNQRTVDNQRALRQLSSDGLHRRMVEQQYQ